MIGSLGARTELRQASACGSACGFSPAKVPRALRRFRKHGDGNDHQFLGVGATSFGDDCRTGASHTPPQDAGTGLAMLAKQVVEVGRERKERTDGRT
jgi:hypothetical protein